MEVDSGAERSTIPLTIFQRKLSDVCQLQPSAVSLQQYDKTPLTISGECQVTVKINDRVIQAKFVVVKVEQQLPLLGRDWMKLLQFDVVTLMEQVTQVHYSSETTNLFTEFTDVFKEELGLLKDIQASVKVDETAPPRFHKPRPVPFALRNKVEEQLDKQVEEGNSSPLIKVSGQLLSLWFTKRTETESVGISRCQLIHFYIPRYIPCPRPKRFLAH